jgi:hypothetical protein
MRRQFTIVAAAITWHGKKRIPFPTGKKRFVLFAGIQATSGVHAGSCQFDPGALFLEVKTSERDGDLSPSPGAQYKNEQDLYVP